MWYFAADVEQQVISRSINTVFIAAAILIICTVAALLANKFLRQKQFKKLKAPLFIPMAVAAVFGTLILAFNTVYLNVKSESKGPVHWHADIEFWACGSEIELRDPTGFLSNKIGTSTYHEHNDKRIHLEGVVVEKSHDASLGKFMDVTGGYINDQGVGIPLNEDSSRWLEDKQDGDEHTTDFRATMSEYVGESAKGPVLNLRDGSATCGGRQAKLQVFVYRFDDDTDTYRQEKLADPADYIIRDKGIVPPGDCVVVEFDTPKRQTDKLCQQYGVRDSERCVAFGVARRDPEPCNIRFEGGQ